MARRSASRPPAFHSAASWRVSRVGLEGRRREPAGSRDYEPTSMRRRKLPSEPSPATGGFACSVGPNGTFCRGRCHLESDPRGGVVPELVRDDAKPVVDKRYGDAVEGHRPPNRPRRAGGGPARRNRGADRRVCSTLHGAITRGYDATLVADAHTTGDLSEWRAPSSELVVTHTNLYWDKHAAPGRTAGTVPTADVSF